MLKFYWVGNEYRGNFGDVLTPRLLDYFNIDYKFVKNRNNGKQNYKILGFKLEGEVSGTLENADLTPTLNPIKQRDLELKQQYNLF